MEWIKLLHAVTGFLVAGTGLLQFVMKKGGKTHRTIGKVYFAAWIVIVTTGAMIGHLLITFFGVLGFYLALSGVRFAQRKNIKFTTMDTVFAAIGIAVGGTTLGWGIWLQMTGSTTFGIIATVFGAIFLGAGEFDVRKFVRMRGNLPKKEWYFEHFQRMMISYIAAMTAFSAINNIFGNTLVNWLLPTVIGTVAIIVYSRTERKKLGMAK